MAVDMELMQFITGEFSRQRELINGVRDEINGEIREVHERIDNHISEDSNKVSGYRQEIDKKINGITSKIVTISTISASIAAAIGFIAGLALEVKKIIS